MGFHWCPLPRGPAAGTFLLSGPGPAMRPAARRRAPQAASSPRGGDAGAAVTMETAEAARASEAAGRPAPGGGQSGAADAAPSPPDPRGHRTDAPEQARNRLERERAEEGGREEGLRRPPGAAATARGSAPGGSGAGRRSPSPPRPRRGRRPLRGGERAGVLRGRAVTQPAESRARAAPQPTVRPRCGFRFPGFARRWLRPRPGLAPGAPAALRHAGAGAPATRPSERPSGHLLRRGLRGRRPGGGRC